MIKALVVDDEKRVRRGFIGLADWSAYGISIVGEAKDGDSALALLGEREIDMMFVDIGMPGMSGFELIDRARSRYPHTKAVILTCHHEFDYVQEALRIGAIDYIVKTLLNKSNVDETMQRIVKRFEWERRQTAGPAQRPFEAAIALAPKGAQPADGQPAPPALGLETRPRRLDGGVWLCHASPRQAEERLRELPAHVADRWQAAWVTAGADEGCSAREAERLIAERLPVWLFYRGDGSRGGCAVSLGELKAAAPGPSAAELTAAFAEWSECRWLLFGEDWRRFAAQIEQWQVEPARLQAWLRALAAEWAPYLGWRERAAGEAASGGVSGAKGGNASGAMGGNASGCADDAVTSATVGASVGAAAGLAGRPAAYADPLADPEELYLWKEWKSWLSAAALLTQRRIAELSMSREVFGSLVRALVYMKQHAGRELNQDEVARRIGMSRSYFSQCFKRFADGESFGDLLRRLRVAQAQALLGGTDLSIRDIAGRVGFEDDKHFSRLFRDRVGMYPSEYRAARQERLEGGQP